MVRCQVADSPPFAGGSNGNGMYLVCEYGRGGNSDFQEAGRRTDCKAIMVAGFEQDRDRRSNLSVMRGEALGLRETC